VAAAGGGGGDVRGGDFKVSVLADTFKIKVGCNVWSRRIFYFFLFFTKSHEVKVSVASKPGPPRSKS